MSIFERWLCEIEKVGSYIKTNQIRCTCNMIEQLSDYLLNYGSCCCCNYYYYYSIVKKIGKFLLRKYDIEEASTRILYLANHVYHFQVVDGKSIYVPNLRVLNDCGRFEDWGQHRYGLWLIIFTNYHYYRENSDLIINKEDIFKVIDHSHLRRGQSSRSNRL